MLVDDGSVTQCIFDLRDNGDRGAANRIYEHYYARLVGRLQHRINRKVQACFDSEDLAQFTLAEILSKLEQGCFPNVTSREGLWALMLNIGTKRVFETWRHATAEKRDVRRRVSSGVLEGDSSCSAFDPQCRQFPPRLAAEVNDMVQYLSDRLSKKEYRRLLIWELQDYSPAEMKLKLEESMNQNISERTFRRWRQNMREELQAAYADTVEA